MPELVKLPTWTAEVHEDVIDMLKDLLAKAEAGEITGIAVAYTGSDEMMTTKWSKAENSYLVIGAVTVLQHRLVAKVIE